MSSPEDETTFQDKKWSMAYLRIGSRTHTAAHVTAMLQTTPTDQHERGSPVRSRRPTTRVREESFWILESGVADDQPLDEHCAQLLDLVEEKLPLFQSFVPDYYMEIRCAFSSEGGQGGFVLGPDLLRRLTLVPLALVVSLYPPGLPEVEEDLLDSPPPE